MAAIGIIANPMSGKDIRRLVSHATAIDNNEKINIIERVVVGAQAMGVDLIVMMPETFNMAYRAVNDLIKSDQLDCEVEVMDYHIYGMTRDTEEAARRLEADPRIGCIVSLGGDGTNRAIAKHIHTTPLISISTGTNNVYPEWVEGTVAGLAAGLVAKEAELLCQYLIRQKRIDIAINGEPRDIALVDAVLSNDPIIGSKAIWRTTQIKSIFVTRCHPASIGFSAIAGVRQLIRKEDNFGGYVHLGDEYDKLVAPVAPGIVELIAVSEMTQMPLKKEVVIEVEERGTLALDGERELYVKPGDKVSFTITRKGPRQVLVKDMLEEAQRHGMFHASKGGQ